MFDRKNVTYDYRPDMILNILNDEANPLNQISRIIPDGAKVLDIGAGNGILACVLKETHKNLVIDGIEPDSYAVVLARRHYRNVYSGFAQDFLDQISAEDYDFIVLADVIEHIFDPYSFLKELILRISAKTKIIISVPNIAFGAVRASLLSGNFDYVDSGILEKTHVRFFTLKTMKSVIENIDMNIEKLYFLQRDIFQTEIPGDNSLSNYFFYRQILRDELSSVYQFLFVLTKKDVCTKSKIFGTKTRLDLFPILILYIKNIFFKKPKQIIKKFLFWRK